MKLQESAIVDQIEPEEDNNNNTNAVVSYRNHLHSALYRLMHTQIGGIGDERAIFFDDNLRYIADEESGGIFLTEQSGEKQNG